MRSQVALREIAGTASYAGRLRDSCGFDPNHGSDSVPVAFRTHQAQRQPVIRRQRVVMPEQSLPAVVGQKHVQPSVIVDVPPGRSAPDDLLREGNTGLQTDLLELRAA